MFRKIKRITREAIDAIRIEHIKHTEGYVVMLHRIGPKEPNRLPCLAELNVTPEFLQTFVDKHRKHYDFISLDEVIMRHENPSQYKRPYIAFTLDDGFKDNLTYGLPFFEKNNIPFAVFVTVDFINRHPAFNYPFILERIIANNNQLFVGESIYNCGDTALKNSTFKSLKELTLQLPYKSFEQSFCQMFSSYIQPEYFEDLTLTWEELKTMASSPFCTIGSHTMTHCRLSKLSKDEIEYELAESKRQLENKIEKEIKYLSYPYGWKTDVNDDVLIISESLYKAGFQSFINPDIWGGQQHENQ